MRGLRRAFPDDPDVTPGRIAAEPQESEAHQSYAGGSFVRASSASTGAQATIDHMVPPRSRLYDMEQVPSSSHTVIDGRLFLVGLSVLDPSFDEDLVRTRVRDALFSEVSVPTLRQSAPGAKLAGGVSSEYVAPTVGISLDWDRMGVTPYVSMLATVICDRNTPMPLSVIVFGEWGSGKNYFMGSASRSRRRLRNDTIGTYMHDIRQISFNAWHYVDSNPLWGGYLSDPEHSDSSGRRPICAALNSALLFK